MVVWSRKRVLIAGLVMLSCSVDIARGVERPVATQRNLLAGVSWGMIRPTEGALAMEEASFTDLPAPSREMLRVRVAAATDPFYHLQIAKNIKPALSEGTRLTLRFWGRSPTRNPIRVAVEKNGPPYTAALERRIVLTADWKEYVVSGETPAYGPGGAEMRIQVGEAAGTFELADIRLLDGGIDPFLARARKAVGMEEIRKRIRKHRMGELSIEINGEDGRPVRGATVRIRQTRQAFLFGCNLFALRPGDESPEQKAYQDRFAALFNFATLPFYWGSFEREAGKSDYDRLQAMADWCAARGITAKGHPLVWHEVYPRWAPADSEKAVPLLRERTRAIISRFARSVHVWDVLNEANAAPSFQPENGESLWVKKVGPVEAVAAALEWAREAKGDSDAVLVYNDFDTSEANVELLRGLKGKDRLPDAIGIQSHMHSAPWSMERAWQVCERFAPFGLPIHFTEMTVLSGNPRDIDFRTRYTDWISTPEGEKAQADAVTGLYALLFSHPSVEAITWWDFSDRGSWMGAPAGFLRDDMSPKPAYERLMEMIRKEWRTDVTAETGTDGKVTVRAFHGDYEIEATDPKGRTAKSKASLDKGGKPASITLRPS